MKNLFRCVTIIAICLLLTGCPPAPTHEGYFGETKPMSEVVANINANNQKITTLWSQFSYELWVHDQDEKKTEHYVHDTGVLLYAKPNEFLMRGNSIKGLLFEVGSSAGEDAQFWVTVTEGMRSQMWGHYKNLGKPCMKMKNVPIRPDLLIEVLGVSDFDTNFLKPPVPVMKFINDAGGFYSFTWSVRAADRWVAVKEVWYNRDYLPIKVLLFDENGRILIRADLTEHRELEGGDGRKIATQYKLFFPDTKDALNFRYLNAKVSQKGIPRPGTIRRRDPGDDIRQVQIDENCVD